MSEGQNFEDDCHFYTNSFAGDNYTEYNLTLFEHDLAKTRNNM